VLENTYSYQLLLYHYMLFNPRFIILSVLLLFCSATSAQQYQSMLHKPYHKRVQDISYLYATLIALNDSTQIFNKVKEIKAFALKHNDIELTEEMELFTLYYLVVHFNIPESSEAIVNRINTVINNADKKNIIHIKIRAMRSLSEYYELAFEKYLLMEKELQKVTNETYPDMAQELLTIGNAYYFFQEYDIAKQYMERVVALKETAFNTRFISLAKNTLGMYYRRLGDWEKSNYYFNEVMNTPHGLTKYKWDELVKGNIGANYYLQKEYDKAIPLFLISFKGAEKHGDFETAALDLIRLSDIYRQKGELKKSWDCLVRAELNINTGDDKDVRRLYYLMMSKWYAVNNKGELASAYMDSAIQAHNEFSEKFSAIKVLRVQQKLAQQEQDLHLAELSLAAQKKTSQRNLLVITVIVLIASVFAVYKIQQRQQQVKDIQLQVANQELNTAFKNLKTFTQSITEKNELIQQLQAQQSEEEKNALIQQLQQSTILTDDDWKTFQEIFDRAYPGFITRVKDTYPELSLGEIRFFVLTKLKLSHKEMAGMMGISPNSIHVIRHRVRKKMGFEDNDIMEQTISSI
jgi:tetratricopeptide (TPR) repeat protein